MVSLTCKQMGMSGCNFSATGKDAEEVKQKLLAHARSAHADVLKGMKPEDLSGLQARLDALLARR
ncbi:MAG: hypothetical protein A2W00_03565 [Candidatus Eisenbacteria bacterium RBG_16_71_46]|nr:MAG: hypothetical protein A2W00_03565 [Candidatus Eisenbacteria bacterium RBG_16_71_46]OGF21846.1 MAG: hypothetical protein A2V63_13910 [Candidatus Eisenbacteria bacterium RBG_19FT_COMBO_70_11]